MIIKQYFRKQAKITRGIIDTYIRKRGEYYNEILWWDTSFYTSGISDRQTISPQKNVISAKYHYSSIEILILKHLFNYGISVNHSNVLDIGSGSGHWIDFYKSLDAQKILGIDVSRSCFYYLQKKYVNNDDIEIYQGRALDIINSLDSKYEIVNAVGVMFHIVDDYEWEDTICIVSSKLNKGGLFIVGGHFGMLDGLNVQIDSHGYINKRLRSKRHWIKSLKKAGFADIRFCKNNAYLEIEDPLPENNLLIATK